MPLRPFERTTPNLLLLILRDVAYCPPQATKYWHWFFQLLPDAEKIIAGDPVSFFNAATKHHDFGAEARASYLEGFKTAEGIHGVSRAEICVYTKVGVWNRYRPNKRAALPSRM